MKKFLKIIPSLILILIIAGLFFVFYNDPDDARADWWNESWQFRQAIQVANNASEETDVYISLTLNTNTASTSMQADCGDFRFTKESGEVLPYYISSGCRTTNNVIHVNFDTFASGEQTIYFYYGNPSAENGFEASDFTTEASNYTIGAVGSEEVGPGPVGYWSFDEGYGTTAHDESRQGNDGTIINAVWQDESMCISGKCLYFDGSGDYVDLGADTSFESDTEGTVNAWVKIATTSKVTIFGYGGPNVASPGYWTIERTEDPILQIAQANEGGASNNHVGKDIGLNDNQWHFISLVGDGNNYNIYLDGELQNTSVKAGTDTGVWFGDQSLTSPQKFSIGGLYHDGVMKLFMEGFIDEVKVYPYVRSADQIKQDYVAGLAGVKSNTGVSASFGGSSDKWMSDGLVGYWKMDETATTSGAIDASGNGNDGTYNDNASTTGGKFGNGGVFDGDGDYVDIPSGVTSGISPFTVCYWIKTTESKSNGTYYERATMFGQGVTGDANGDFAIVSSAGNIGMWGGLSTADDNSFLSSTSINDNEWHFICAINDDTNIKLYVDKVFIDQLSSGASALNSNAFWIGSLNWTGVSSNHYHQGSYDEVRIYNRALSPEEVRKLYEWAPGPVAHWKMDEKSGGTVYDSSGNGNDGVLGGGTASYEPAWSRGKYGNALVFDGDDDNTVVASNEIFDIQADGGFTASLWFKKIGECDGPTAYGNEAMLSRFGNDYTDRTWVLGCDGDSNTMTIHLYDAGATDVTATGTTVVEDGLWHHAAWTYDGIEGKVKLYVDGIKEAEADFTLTQDLNYSYPLCVGGYDTNCISTYDYHGYLDDIKIYNYARTQKQILEDMNGGRPARKSPVLHLSFDEGYGGTAYDSSVYGNDGVLGGGTASYEPAWSSGKYGNALVFDGDNDNTVVTTNEAFDIQTDGGFTASLWFKKIGECDGPNAWGNEVMLSRFGNDSTDRTWWFGCDGDSNVLVIDLYDAGATNAIATGTTVVEDGLWHHAAWTYDGIEGKVKLYVDGAKEDEVDFTLTQDMNYSYPLCVGGYTTDCISTFDYHGYLDDVKIYNYALSAEEIEQEYSAGGASIISLGGEKAEANNNGSIVTGNSAKYCIPGDTATCTAPVLELDFNEREGTTAYDKSGNGNDGVLGGGTTNYEPAWSRGKYGNALVFDGDDDNTVVASNEIFDIQTNGGFTASLWFKKIGECDSVSGNEVMLSRFGNDHNDRTWWFGCSGDSNVMIIYLLDAGATNAIATGTTVVEDGLWHHAAWTYDGIEGKVKLYVDGEKEDEVDFTLTQDMNYSRPLCVGGYGSSCISTYDYHGYLDDVKIYNYARTPAQIAWDYNRGKPIAHYSFDECQGSIIHDESENKNHGVLNLGAVGVTATGTCASSSDSFWYNSRTGKKNSGASFDGNSDVIIIPDSAEQRPSQVTMSAWVKSVDSDVHDDFLISKQTNDGDEKRGYYMRFNDPQETVSCVFGVGDAIWQKIVAYEYENKDEWHHILCSYDKESAKMYINGELKDELVFSITEIDYTGVGDLYISGAALNHALSFQGMMDEVMIWNYALTAEQVKNVYNGGAVKFD